MKFHVLPWFDMNAYWHLTFLIFLSEPICIANAINGKSELPLFRWMTIAQIVIQVNF
jgi:hypothetical protein